MALVGQVFGQADDNVGVVNLSLASFAAGQFLLIALTDDNDSTTEVPDVDIGGVTLSPNRSFGPWGPDNQTDFVFSRVLTAADITAGQVVITPNAGSDWKNISANATAYTGRSGTLNFNTEQVSVGAVDGNATMNYGTLTPQAGSDIVAIAFTDNVSSLQDKDFQDITLSGGGTAGFTETVDPTDISWASQSVYVKENVAAAATGTLNQNYTGSGQAGWRTALIELLPAAAAPTATVTGTAIGSNTESSIGANDKTLITTLTDGTWVTAGAAFDAQRQAILDSFVSDVTEANGFNEERANVLLSNVVRTSDTVVTITLNDMSAIDVAETHTITNTGLPAAAIDGASSDVVPAAFTFTITEDPATESITPVEFAANQPFQRVIGGSVANVAVKPFAYTTIVGVSTVEYRLFDSLGVTVRQDWTALSDLSLGASGTGTMSVPTSRDSYRYQLRTKDAGDAVLATSAIMTNEFRAGLGIMMTGDSDPSGFMNQGPAHALANGVWRFNNVSNAWENSGATIAIGAIILIANQLAADEDCAVFLVDGTKVGGGLQEFQSPGGAMYDELVRIRNVCETDVEIIPECLGANDVFSGTLVYATVLGWYDTLRANLRSIFGANARIVVIPPSRDDGGGNDANWTILRRANKASADLLAFVFYCASLMWELMESFHYPDSVEQGRGKDILLQTFWFILGLVTFYRGPRASWTIDGSNLATVNFDHNGTDITVSGSDNGLDFKNNGTPVSQGTVTKVNSTTVTVQLSGPANQLSIGEGAIPFPAGEGIVDNVSFGTGSSGLVMQPVFDLPPILNFDADAIVVSTAAGDLDVSIDLIGAAVVESTADSAISTSISMSAASLAVMEASGNITSSINLSAAASGEVDSNANLDNQIQLSGVAINTVNASASLNAGSSFDASAVAQVATTGDLTANITLNAEALNEALSTAGLTAGINLDADALADADSNANLSVGSGLQADASSQSNASAVLNAQITFAGSAQSVAAAIASLAAASNEMTANAIALVDATANLAAQVNLSGDASAEPSAEASLIIAKDLTANATSVVVATADLTVISGLSAAALVNANASGELTTSIRLMGFGQAAANAFGSLIGTVSITPYWFESSEYMKTSYLSEVQYGDA